MTRRRKETVAGLLLLGVVASASADPAFAEELLTLPPAEGPVKVRTSFELQDIHSINDETESFSLTGILTAVAYQNMVGNILPRIAYVTLIHAFLSISFLLMCASAVINLAVGRFDKRGRHELGERIDLHCRKIFPLIYAGTMVISGVVIWNT